MDQRHSSSTGLLAFSCFLMECGHYIVTREWVERSWMDIESLLDFLIPSAAIGSTFHNIPVKLLCVEGPCKTRQYQLLVRRWATRSPRLLCQLSMALSTHETRVISLHFSFTHWNTRIFFGCRESLFLDIWSEDTVKNLKISKLICHFIYYPISL